MAVTASVAGVVVASPPPDAVGSSAVAVTVSAAGLAGLRCAEIAALQAEDVWTHADPPVVVVRHGKGAKDRSVPMHPELVSLMHGLPPHGPVFPGEFDRPLRAPSVSRRIAEHMATAGVDGTPHQLRHSFGTELARVSGGNLLLIAEWMGHASASTAMNYARLAMVGGGEVVGGMYGPAA